MYLFIILEESELVAIQFLVRGSKYIFCMKSIFRIVKIQIVFCDSINGSQVKIYQVFELS